MSDFPGVTHVVITVRDLSTSVPWYQRLIGADPVLDEDTGPFRHVVWAVGDGLLSLHGFHEGVPSGDAFDERPATPRTGRCPADRPCRPCNPSAGVTTG